MGISIAQAIVDTLEAFGVKYIFGMPGSQNLEIYDCLASSKIHSVLVVNELQAPFMASGYAWSSSEIGVCLSIPGPGLTNMITGLAGALVDSIPLLILVPSIKSQDKSFFLHEINQMDVVRPIVKNVFKIEEEKDVPSVLQQALSLSIAGDPGPVVVEIPRSFLKRTIEPKSVNFSLERKCPEIEEKALTEIVEILKSSERCGLYIGRGASQSTEEIIQFAEALSAPVACTISGQGSISYDHPLSVGFGFGPSGTNVAEEIFNSCDTLIAIGCKFSEMATGQWGLKIPEKFIHVDINKEVFDKNYPATISLQADAKDFLSKILSYQDQYAKEQDPSLLEQIQKGKESFEQQMQTSVNQEYVNPGKFYYILRKLLNKEDILTVDCGYHQIWAFPYYAVYRPKTFISSTDYQAMGFGVPSAIGAKLANLDKNVVCVCGDGGFLMTGMELLTAKKMGLNVKVVIFNDGDLGLMKYLQKERYGRDKSTSLLNPRFEDFAKALHLEYSRIENEEDLEEKLQHALQSEEAMIIDVNIQYKERPRYYEGLVKTIWNNLSPEERMKITEEMIIKKRNQ